MYLIVRVRTNVGLPENSTFLDPICHHKKWQKKLAEMT